MKSVVDKLKRKQQTNDPLQIADNLGYLIISAHLEGIRGFYQHIKRQNIIYYDVGLPPEEVRFVVAHELGHSILHRGMNRVFLDHNTLVISDRYEREANCFAALLLYNDEDLYPLSGFSVEQVATALGLPLWLAEWRIQQLDPIQTQFWP